MIAARCYTNLDDFRLTQWPDAFPEVPRVGDYVEALDGKRLRVCTITWKASDLQARDLNAPTMLRLGCHRAASLLIELHR